MNKDLIKVKNNKCYIVTVREVIVPSGVVANKCWYSGFQLLNGMFGKRGEIIEGSNGSVEAMTSKQKKELIELISKNVVFK